MGKPLDGVNLTHLRNFKKGVGALPHTLSPFCFLFFNNEDNFVLKNLHTLPMDMYHKVVRFRPFHLAVIKKDSTLAIPTKTEAVV